MQTLEHSKYPLSVFLRKALAIIGEREKPVFATIFSPNADLWRHPRACVFHRVAQQVLEQLTVLPLVTGHYRQGGCINARSGYRDGGLKFVYGGVEGALQVSLRSLVALLLATDPRTL